jgi:hypothetical protein
MKTSRRAMGPESNDLGARLHAVASGWFARAEGDRFLAP